VTRVLVVEDDVVLRTAIRVTLGREGHEVAEAGDGGAALAEVRATAPDAIVLDLGLPDIDGLDLLPRLRALTAAPVVVLTARDDRPTTIAALDAGADDYVTKPFHRDLFTARVRAVLRRGGVAARSGVVEVGDLRIDLVARSVERGGVPVPLTPTERRLLEALVRRPGVLRPHADLLHEVWGPAYGTETTYLRTYVRQLRSKLGDDAADPRCIATEAGVGYRWIAEPGGRPDPPVA
jgi:two-component system KDP operon response regulator KdpE